MIKAARLIQAEGICSLSTVFHAAFPDTSYNTAFAKQRLLRMPIVAIRIGLPLDVKLMEFIRGVDYIKVHKVLSAHQSQQTSSSNAPCITKAEFRQLFSFAQTRREREQLTYAVVKSSGISATAARKHLGIHNIAQRAGKVEDAIEEAERIHECIESLSVTQEKALLLSLGIPFSSDSESDASSSELEDVSQSTEMSSVTLSEEPIVQVLRKSGWNWFECLDQIEQQMSEVKSDRDDTQLDVFAEKITQS